MYKPFARIFTWLRFALPLFLLIAAPQQTQAQAPAAPPPDAAAAAPAPPPPPYSLPWQLRPVAVANVVRSDTAFAFYKNPVTKNSGSTIASMLLATYKVTPDFAPLLRLGIVSNSPPDPPAGMPKLDSALNFLNPVL